jgi:hypothetical protein
MSERVMIDVLDPQTIWFVPFNDQKGTDYAEGDCSYIRFHSKEEVYAYVLGLARGRGISACRTDGDTP